MNDSNFLGLYGGELLSYLRNVGGTPGRDGPGNSKPNWRNRFYGLPERYDANALYDGKYAQPSLHVVNKILHEAAKRARKQARP